MKAFFCIFATKKFLIFANKMFYLLKYYENKNYQLPL